MTKNKQRKSRKELKRLERELKQAVEWWGNACKEIDTLLDENKRFKRELEFALEWKTKWWNVGDKLSEKNRELHERITELESDLADTKHDLEAANITIEKIRENLFELITGRIADWLNAQGEMFTGTPSKEWPPGYFAETAGCLADDPIERNQPPADANTDCGVEHTDTPYGHDFNQDNMRIFPDGTVEYAGQIFPSLAAAYKCKDDYPDVTVKAWDGEVKPGEPSRFWIEDEDGNLVLNR